ncbi:sulfotransferase [Colwelliaceae bacterium BS250]
MNSRIAILLEQAKNLEQQGQLSSAVTYAKKVLKKQPGNIEANNILLAFSQLNNDFKTIAGCISVILASEPENSKALLAKLDLFEMKELHFEAILLHEKLAALNVHSAKLSFRKALCCISAGKVDDAEKALLFCCNDKSVNPFVYLNLGHVYKAKGNADLAVKNYKHFIEVEPKNSGVGYWSLADLKSFKFSEQLTEQMESYSTTENIGQGSKGLTFFALGRAYEQQNMFAKSYQAMSFGNQIISQNRPFKAQPFAHLIKNFIANLTHLSINPVSTEQQKVVFIVGMPRSGTTLIEQILASHSTVESTDELPYIERIALELEMAGGYVHKLANLSIDETEKYRKQYLEQAGQYFQSTPETFIDKNPNNFLHLALIKKLFPEAKIINVMRDPLDNAMSVFKQHFSNGHDYSYSIPGITFYWQGYLSLMFHWDKLFSKQIYHLSYERLVAEPENQIRLLLNYCQLDFEADCLTFYKSKRVVLTPSVSQVQQPINNKSIGSWKKYEQFIQPHLAGFNAIKNKAKELFK